MVFSCVFDGTRCPEWAGKVGVVPQATKYIFVGEQITFPKLPKLLSWPKIAKKWLFGKTLVGFQESVECDLWRGKHVFGYISTSCIVAKWSFHDLVVRREKKMAPHPPKSKLSRSGRQSWSEKWTQPTCPIYLNSIVFERNFSRSIWAKKILSKLVRDSESLT